MSRGDGRGASWVGLAVALACALAPARGFAEKKKQPGLFEFETWKTPVAREREAAKDLAPGQLDVTPLGERRVDGVALRLRIYADRDYRAGLHWQTKFRTQLDRLNRVVRPLFGVWFEVEAFKDWDRTHAGVALEKVVDELGALDGGDGVDWVVGLVTPFRGVATDVHHVGMAPLSSRHFVLRAMDDAEEGRALDRELAMLPPGERDRLYGDRKAHKELIVLLHEWAHTMGVLHVEDRAMLMNPHYDPKQAAFTDFEKRLIELVLEKRTGDRTKAFPESAELAALIRAAPRDEGAKVERDDLIRFLESRGTGAPPVAAKEARPSADGAGDATLVQQAQAAAAAGAYTKAEAALARAGARAAHVQELTAAIVAARARVALPRESAKAGVKPEDEPRYVALFDAAMGAIESRNRDAAGRVAELAAAFPDSAGRDVAACELAFSGKRYAEAEKSCQAALVKDPGALRAHLALGRLGARTRRYPEAEKHYRRALLLAPSDPAAWSELGQLYRATGSETQRDRLAREHEALFSSPLPP